MKKWIIVCLLGMVVEGHAQQSALLQQYRVRVKEYNQDIRSADYAIAMRLENEKSARADFLPSLSGGANFNYTGHPLELSVAVPSLNEPLSFQGRDTKYGASLSLLQPVYSGGALKAGYNKAVKESELSRYEKERVANDIVYNADVYYWNKVACDERVRVAEAFKASVSTLVEVVRHRVTEGYTDRNDLLMAEVKLNDAEYRLAQARNDAEVARLSMNSFSGVPFDQVQPTDSVVLLPMQEYDYALTVDAAMMGRPELQIASGQVEIQKSVAKLANAQYLPKFAVGIDGSYASPGYDFTSDLDPNYVVYAKLSVPIFEWGKRKNTRKAGRYGVSMALENQSKQTDKVRLEVETAFYTYSRALRDVQLTESSLSKASESESLAMDKYREGDISIVEVINAQLYHQEAKVNHIQSKLTAQIAKSALEKAMGQIDD